MRGPASRSAAAVVAVLLFFSPGPGTSTPLAGQGAPPPPGPTPPPGLPTVVEEPLPDGATLMAVRSPEQPWAAVHLAFPGGRRLDPPGMEGAVGLVVDLVGRGAGGAPDGTAGDAREILRELDLLGAELEAVAEDDAVHLRLGLPSVHLERGLRLLRDVVRRSAFSPAAVADARERTARLLEGRRESAEAVAGRALRATVYGPGHPYGRFAVPESVREVAPDDLLRVHRRALAWSGARVVVAGDVDPDRLPDLLRGTLFAGEAGTPSPAPAAGAGPAPPPVVRDRPEVVVVHQPAAGVAAVEVGHVLPGANAPEWPALAVLGEVLGDRLAAAYRARGWSHPVAARLERRRGWSLLRVTTRVPGAAVDSAAAVVVDALTALRDGVVPPRELRRAVDVLAGSFLLALETPAEVAEALARAGLHGGSPEDLRRHPARLEELGPVELREVARAHLHVEQAVIAAAGDAVRLVSGLRDLGPVAVVDPAGRTVDPADLAVPRDVRAWEATALEPVELRYRLSVRGMVGDEEAVVAEPAGTLTPLGWTGKTLSPLGEAEGRELPPSGAGPAGAMRFSSELEWLGRRTRQEVTFTAPGFEPLAASFSVAGDATRASLRVADGRVVGRIRLPDSGPREVDRPLPAGAVLGEMQELALWLLEPRPGELLRFRAISLESGEPVEVTVRLLATEAISVPAGRFRANLLEVVSGGLVQRVHVRRRRPHVVLRLETPGQPVVMELEEWR